jgi:hypothetical protein
MNAKIVRIIETPHSLAVIRLQADGVSFCVTTYSIKEVDVDGSADSLEEAVKVAKRESIKAKVDQKKAARAAEKIKELSFDL